MPKNVYVAAMYPILSIENVSKSYASHQALQNVSLVIPQGSIFGLLGPNGAGKTSLIRIITQITQPDSGTVFFKNQPLAPTHIASMGYLPEERGLYKKMEVGEQLLYFAQLKGLSKKEALQKLKIWVEKFEIQSWWNKKVEELSKGMQQKIQFIATVLHQPELLILDEPFSGFDPINAQLITTEILALKQQGTTIIFSTHRMESVEQLCDDIALIHQSKKILEGAVSEIKGHYKSNEFIVEHANVSLHIDEHIATIVSSKNISAQITATCFKLNPNSTQNDLIKPLLDQTIIFKFEEQLPDMQQIFVQAVKGMT
jgi:ABC-2 type transport system ATP-binding protein